MKGVEGLNLFKKNFRFQEKISSLLYSLVSGENKSHFDLSRSVMAESQNRQAAKTTDAFESRARECYGVSVAQQMFFF